MGHYSVYDFYEVLSIRGVYITTVVEPGMSIRGVYITTVVPGMSYVVCTCGARYVYTWCVHHHCGGAR